MSKLKDTYMIKPDAPFFLKEFGYYCLDRWIAEGHLDPKDKHADYNAYLRDVFGFDEPQIHGLGMLGGTTAPFMPGFPVEVLEDRGAHEVVRDAAGRHVLYFKNRRDGFMPEYIDHPVKDMATWESECKWRLDPDTPERIAGNEAAGRIAADARADGKLVSQYFVGAYMYLRSLMGPTELLYNFYDQPELIHACMEQWYNVMTKTMARYQKYVTIDELLIDEDICYNVAPLISYDMMREFLFPYYKQLIADVKARQLDKNAKLFVHLATDGKIETVMDIYAEEIGANVFSPFEVASGCDVVELGKKYPNVVMSGGIDKRVLATTPEQIDRYLDGILPAMRKRGGYIPTCDHGVPEEVSFENYVHYRKRVAEYAK